MKPRILVVDDEKDLREMLNHNLSKHGYIVTEASDGEEALRLIHSGSFELIILDIMMPHYDGYEVCRQIRAAGNATPLIFLTARDTEYDEVVGLELGADDFIRKPFGIQVLISRIRSIIRRMDKSDTFDQILHFQSLNINPNNYEVKIGIEKIFLPRKEFELLYFLASHLNKVFTRRDLLEQIWNDETYVIDRTVDVHIGRIRKKLGSYKNLIQTVTGVGYCFKTQ